MTSVDYWPQAIDDTLIALATYGENGVKLTTNEIAKRVGRRADIVAKRLHKLGVGRVKLRDAVKQMIEVSATSSCKWIEGDPRTMDYCGAPTMLGKSWCEPHFRRAYVAGSSFVGKTAGRIVG